MAAAPWQGPADAFAATAAAGGTAAALGTATQAAAAAGEGAYSMAGHAAYPAAVAAAAAAGGGMGMGAANLGDTHGATAAAPAGSHRSQLLVQFGEQVYTLLQKPGKPLHSLDMRTMTAVPWDEQAEMHLSDVLQKHGITKPWKQECTLLAVDGVGVGTQTLAAWVKALKEST